VSYRIIEEKYRTRIRISLIDGDGELIEGQYKLSAELNSVDAKGAAKLYRVIDGEKKHVSFKYSDSLAFTAIAGEEYILSEEYRVSVTPSDLAEILISGDVFTVGDEVSVSVESEPQIEIRELYYLDADGKKTVINGGVFKMPDSNVTVYAECYKKVYTVIFADGKNVLSVQSVPWGEMPQVPENPLRASDGEYSYTFKGWSREVVPVSRNVTYSAVYEKTPLPPKVEPGGLQISDPVKKILLTAAVLAVLFVVLIVTVLVVIIRKKLRK
ncbi:MAG: hypothetical protein IIX96_01785, partial [Clostridia bacterium]|nr:hypothetical protein [Clostridia bacterium]